MSTTSAGWTGCSSLLHDAGHRGRPGHADGRPAALVPAPAPRGAPGHPGRAGARRRVPPGLLPVEPRVRAGGGRRSPGSWPCGTATHPAVVLWHVNNEYGAPLGECYCETSAAAFRDWLRDRYGDLDTLNDRWGAAFWSQRYGEWDEIDVPRTSTTVVNPAQRLDFARFSSDALLDCFRRERDILHELSPGIPVTTNFMANNCKSVDYWRWAPEVDVISNDNYLIAERTDGHLDLAMSADLTRSLAGGGPWLLMEHSTSAVSWQPRNIAKRPGRDAPQLARARGPGRGRRAVLPVAGQPVRRGEAPLGDAAAGRHGHPDLARGRRARRRAGRPGRAARHRGRAGHRAAVGLGVVVGAGAGVAAKRRPRLPGAGPGLVRGVLAGRADRRLRPPARPT